MYALKYLNALNRIQVKIYKCYYSKSPSIVQVSNLTNPKRTIHYNIGSYGASSANNMSTSGLLLNVNQLSVDRFKHGETTTCSKNHFSTDRPQNKHEEGSKKQTSGSKGSRSTLYYLTAVGVLAIGMSYAAVPLYRIFCQAYSYGGTVQEGINDKVETMTRIKERVIRIRFNADTAAAMTWNFRPQQTEIKITPGETALAFYTAKNPTDRPVIGVSTYNVLPFDAGQYFNKIQCFCFEEQMLGPHELVHMPVFFYIDPEFADDPKMENTDLITLSYTFFEAKEGIQLPIPSFART